MDQQKIADANQAQNNVVRPHRWLHSKQDQVSQWYGSCNPRNHKRLAVSQVKPMPVAQVRHVDRAPTIEQAIRDIHAPGSQRQRNKRGRRKAHAESRSEKPAPNNRHRWRVETQQVPPDPKPSSRQCPEALVNLRVSNCRRAGQWGG